MTSPSPCATDKDIGNVLLIPAAVFIVPSVLTTILRLWARRNSLGTDDWTILIASILTIVLNALSIVGVKHGKGRHVCALDDESMLRLEDTAGSTRSYFFGRFSSSRSLSVC